MNDSDPTPDDYSSSEAYHGTSCAGEVAMIKDNGVCGVGVAYSSHVAGKVFRYCLSFITLSDTYVHNSSEVQFECSE